MIAVGIGILFGTPIGAVAGYYRGRVDEVIMRTMDAFLAVPPILMALVIVAILGSSLFNTMIAIGFVYIPRFARVIRGSVLSEREKEYVEAAKMVGEPNLSILFRQILPNSLSPLIVQATVFIAYAILTEAALSFLGLGIAPPNPSWGSMLNEARLYIESDPLLAIIPGPIHLDHGSRFQSFWRWIKGYLGSETESPLNERNQGLLQMNDYLLNVRNLVTEFTLKKGILRAVDQVSFDLRKGETFGLVGESGCGKSVTALSILRLNPSPPAHTTGRFFLRVKIFCQSRLQK